MILEVSHKTGYSYASPTSYTVQSLRLTPPSFDGQKILSWTVSAPGLEDVRGYVDAFGNRVNLVAVATPHDRVDIEASGVIETEDRAGIVCGLHDPAPCRLFLRDTPRTAPNDDIRDLAKQSVGRDTLETLHSLMALIRKAVSYEVGSSSSHTTAAQALSDGKGVCQDHAHVFISAARTLAIPARYVNGYFLSETAAPSEAHHAWAEAWVDGLGWVGFDPANGISPTDRYVRLACGLDSAGSAPVRGTQRGGRDETLDVAVEVQQQAVQQ